MHSRISVELNSIDGDSEVEALQSVLQQILSQIDASFTKVLRRVYQIQSVTFLNYKFKDVLGFFQLMLEESYRLNAV